MKYVRIGISLAVFVVVFISLYIPTNDYVVRIEDGVIKTSEDKEITPIEKTLDGEIDRLAVKYSLSSSTVRAVARCESSMYGSAINHNKNGTIDKGYLQINSIHYENMAQLGLSSDSEWDLLEFGFILMKEQGLQPWSASKTCWINKI
jgi:hypothetical protein